MKLICLFLVVVAATAEPTKDEKFRKASYGPDNCVETYPSDTGTCIVETKCKEDSLKDMNMGLVCAGKKGEMTRHVFGKDSFGHKEKFDTLIPCTQCLAIDNFDSGKDTEEAVLKDEVETLKGDVRSLGMRVTKLEAGAEKADEKADEQADEKAEGKTEEAAEKKDEKKEEKEHLLVSSPSTTASEEEQEDDDSEDQEEETPVVAKKAKKAMKKSHSHVALRGKKHRAKKAKKAKKAQKKHRRAQHKKQEDEDEDEDEEQDSEEDDEQEDEEDEDNQDDEDQEQADDDKLDSKDI